MKNKESSKLESLALTFRFIASLLILVLFLSMIMVPAHAATMSITLESPSDNTLTINNQPDFRFIATHTSNPTLNCTLWLKLTTSGTSTAYGTNSNVAKEVSTTIIPTSPIPNGQYQWWITCSDGTETISSALRTITVNVIRGDRTFTASLDGSTRYYWLDLPDHFNTSAPTPLVIFLHGYGKDRSTYRTWYPGLRQVFHQNGWIVACPESRTITSGGHTYSAWYTAPSRSDITDVITLLEQEFSIDRSHIHVSGISMGGSGTLQYAMFNPEIVASVCPIMGVTNFTEFYNWPQVDPTLKTSIRTVFGGTPSQVPLVYKNESPLGNEIRFKHTPVFLLHGSTDTVVPVSNSRNLYNSLMQAGYDVKYIEVPNIGHTGDVLVSGREQVIFEWFRDHPLYSAVLPLPGITNPPTDPDSDGLYEDLNANARKDFNDVVLMFNHMQWIAANEPVTAFDFNGNGRIDFNDIVNLFGEI